jgi:hypothetical protein
MKNREVEFSSLDVAVEEIVGEAPVHGGPQFIARLVVDSSDFRHRHPWQFSPELAENL